MKEAKDETEHEDQIIKAIGKFGNWHLRYILVAGLIMGPCAIPMLTGTFLNIKTDFWCKRPDLNRYPNPTEWRKLSSPLIEKGGKLIHDQCNIWNSPYNYRPPNNATVPCSSWEYDRSVFPNTITHYFNLVCDRQYYLNLTQTLYFAGILFGALLAGYLSDKYGRRKCMFPLVIGVGMFGSLSAFANTIELLIILRFFHGFCTVGVFTVCFVWVMEIVGGKWQTIIGIGFEFFWDLGWISLALLAYATTDWKHIQLITSLPVFLLLILVWYLPESPKWLLVSGRLKEAEEIVRQAAEVNKMEPLPENWSLIPVRNEKESKRSVLCVFTHKQLFIKTIVCCLGWFSNAFVYYGLTLNAGSFTSAVKLNFLINGILEIPAYSFVLWALLKRGRKVPYVVLMIIGGTILFLNMIVPQNAFPYDWPLLVLAVLGKFLITGTFGILVVYASELYPTEIRSASLCVCSMFGRIGGMVAPYVGDLSHNFGPSAPLAIFGLSAIIAGCAAIILPETQNRKLPDTVEEEEEIKNHWKDGIFY